MSTKNSAAEYETTDRYGIDKEIDKVKGIIDFNESRRHQKSLYIVFLICICNEAHL